MKKRFEAAALVALFLAVGSAAARAPAPPADAAPRVYEAEIVAEYPHRTDAFTQGLYFRDGALFEGTGQYGESSLRRVALETGEVMQKRALPDEIFGEGIAPWGDRIVGLTWRNGQGFVFDGASFETVGVFAYEGEGWGLTEDGSRLIMSDGTDALRFLDPDDFSETGRVAVTYRGKPLRELNELEWIDGEVFANIWRTDFIARIDPDSGRVTGVIDLRPLRRRLGPEGARAEVLNGIAWDAEGRRLFVTGKYWPKLFEIRLVEKPAAAR